jgi:hypothetical protein
VLSKPGPWYRALDRAVFLFLGDMSVGIQRRVDSTV